MAPDGVAGTAELIGWDGSRVAAILTGEDARAGAALVPVGPRGYYELILLHGLTEMALLPSNPGRWRVHAVSLEVTCDVVAERAGSRSRRVRRQRRRVHGRAAVEHQRLQ